MKVLVTGGAGYIGSTLVPLLLSSGHHVRVLDSLMYGGESLLGVWSHPEFEFQKGDVRDKKVIRSALEGMDAVVHLAAIVGDPACSHQPEVARSINLDASLELLAESSLHGASRFVFASTCSNYGRMKDSRQYVDETSELSPLSLYAETKVSVEQAILSRSQSDGLVATPLRLATVMGVSPRMRFDLTVNEFTMLMLTQKHLVVFGEQFWRPYIHVRDVARGIQTILSAPANKVKNEVFNLGATSQNYQKSTIVELIRPFAPDATIEFVHKEEDPRDYRVSFTKIEHELGFKTTATVEDAVREVAHLVQDGVIQDFSKPMYRNVV